MKVAPTMRNRYLVIADIFLTVIAILGAYALRLELGALFFYYLPSAYWMIGVGILIKLPVYYLFGMYRRLWGYASTRELRLILFSVTSASVLVSVIMILLLTFKVFTGFPRSVLVIDWLLSMILIGGIRFTLRLLSDSMKSITTSIKAKQAKRSLIIGAGDAGALVVKELQKNPELNLKPVGFLDDNPVKMKQQIHGIPVVGTVADLSRILDHKKVDEVIIAIPSASGSVIRKVADECRLKNIPFRTMPGIYELLGGKVSISRLREVDITDLLRRQPTHMKEELIGEALSGKAVLVTGAGGSIGRELCRQIARWNPSKLILLGHGENSIFESLLEIQESFPVLPIAPVIVDVRDFKRLNQKFQEQKPEVVFHAAAHKHVPLMEMNIAEAVDNNVRGTRNVVRASEVNGVKQMVMISTDKAIRPANIMGATKRIAEMIVLDAAARTGNKYEVVRFGNVLGSRGSVVPLFKHQIANGGPVTITHPDMKRYFMTIPEAVYLVLQAAGMGGGGETFVLNMGEQVFIRDLAEDLIRLSGLEPNKDIQIQYTGIRPGEKLSEDLWEEGNQFQPTQHPDIYQYDDPGNLKGDLLSARVETLLDLADKQEAEEIIQMMDQTIPGSSIGATPAPELLSIE